MSNSNVIYTNIRYNYDETDNNENDLETTTMYYLMDYINRNR